MEEIRFALQSIFAHKMRSILTMLGVIIGIAAIISIFSIIGGNTEKMKREMIGGNNNTMNIQYDRKSAFQQNLMSGGILSDKEEKKPLYFPFLGEEVLKQINEIPEVLASGLSYQKDGKIYRKAKGTDAKVSAVTSSVEELEQLNFIKGEGFGSQAFKENQQVIFLENELYDELFPNEEGIGQFVEVNGVPFKVQGVFKLDPNSSNIFSFEKRAYVPLQQAHKLSDELDIVPLVTIQTNHTDQLQTASEKAAEILNQQIPPSDYEYGIMNLSEFARELERMNQSSFILLTGIASISLLVGGIGVMNIMLVSVTERTKEIGIKKALGARRKTILKQFLVEAVVLTLIGGVLGVLIGLLSGYAITQSLDYPYIVSALSIVGSLIFSSMMGIIFGLLPAMKASKLNPIEALRFE
ncbi:MULTISPECIES: ABC transporter permease [Enterococcus]|uniref:ABC transporter permease n=1 Tax=Candidatus Enterococcus mangumiae TaxID=2230878 RepID=A0ABZ2T258_9ENTE|nr:MULTISPECIES: ABC transporter permease [unclassified Enterococcus]MBO0461780.1 ABC transporter permease [Enterococcus sp. DIV1298c]MBO0490357.1 ABC transporter permease [Enterococcus sp. DIV1094]MBO1300368.1 ABC transporter permease [Enterococcus sp. DIV1271a]